MYPSSGEAGEAIIRTYDECVQEASPALSASLEHIRKSAAMLIRLSRGNESHELYSLMKVICKAYDTLETAVTENLPAFSQHLGQVTMVLCGRDVQPFGVNMPESLPEQPSMPETPDEDIVTEDGGQEPRARVRQHVEEYLIEQGVYYNRSKSRRLILDCIACRLNASSVESEGSSTYPTELLQCSRLGRRAKVYDVLGTLETNGYLQSRTEQMPVTRDRYSQRQFYSPGNHPDMTQFMDDLLANIPPDCGQPHYLA